MVEKRDQGDSRPRHARRQVDAAVSEKETAAAASAAPAASEKPSEALKPGKRKRSPWSIVFVIALVVFIISISILGLIGLSYCQGQQKYDDVAKQSGLNIESVENLDMIEVDWDALRAVNPEVVAWVYMPNTPINYPIVQASDNDKYLTIDFDGDAGWFANYGAIFLDYRNAPDFSDQVNFIYGHHMNDGSMFAALAGLPDQARFDECRTIYLLTPSGNYKLRTFALLHVEATDPIVQNKFADDAEFREYLQDKLDRSVVDPGEAIDIKHLDRVFALATCDDYGAGRYVLFSRIEALGTPGLTGEVGVAEEGGEAVGLDEALVETDGEASGQGEGAGEEYAEDSGEEYDEGNDEQNVESDYGTEGEEEA